MQFDVVAIKGCHAISTTAVELTDGDVIWNQRKDAQHNVSAGCPHLSIRNGYWQRLHSGRVIRRNRCHKCEGVWATAEDLARRPTDLRKIRSHRDPCTRRVL